MGGLALMVVAVYVGLAAIELPGLWGARQRRGELWAVIFLLVAGLVFGVLTALGYGPPSIWKLVKAVFGPLGYPLLRPKGG